jgi:glutamate carboxypeptidase
VNDLQTVLGIGPRDAAERVLARARRYVEYETPSRAEAAIVELAEVIAGDIASCGGVVERHDVPGYGRNLTARIAGREDGLDPVLVMAHIDTVHPIGTLAERPFRIEDGRAFAPGIYDMKGGLAAVIEALAWLRGRGAAPRRPVRLLITCDEEIGSHSARSLIEEQARSAAFVLVPEPSMPDGGVKTFRKGVATYRMEATGRAAHAGIEGASAVSAITALIRGCDQVLRLADHDRGTTINIGLIAGGSASNVVAASAWATVDVRLAEPTEAERVHSALLAISPYHPDAGLAVRLTEDRPPLVRTDAVAALYGRARDLAADMGVALTEGGTGGGSDGSIAAATGAATLDGLGPRGGGAHAVDEHIVVEDLAFRLALMTRLLENL